MLSTGDGRCVDLGGGSGHRGGRGGHREAVPGSSLTVSLPRNNFDLGAGAEYVFVAGGIGITPLLPMIAAAEAAGAAWTMHYGGRSRQSMAYLDEVAVYGDRVGVLPQDEYGVLPLADILARSAPRAQVYCCGPEPLLAAVESVIGPRDAQRLHVERFRPRPTDEESAPDRDFTVRIASTGATVRVDEGQSIVDAPEGVDDRRGDVVPRGHVRELRDLGSRRRGMPSRFGAFRR